MSFMLPISQIIGRTSPDPAAQTGAPAPADGAFFANELRQALGATAAPQTAPTVEGAPTLLPEQLDPVGAALRALLSGEGAQEAPDDLGLPEPTPDQAEPVPPEDSAGAAVELAAQMAMAMAVTLPPELVPVPVSTDQQAPVERQTPVQPQAPVDPAPTQAPIQPPVMAATAEAVVPERAAQTLGRSPVVTEALAQALPEMAPKVETESESVADRSASSGMKAAAAKGPTFDDLVQLITDAQSSDAARQASKPSRAEPALEPALERATASTTEPASETATEPAPESASPIGHRPDAPKLSFGELRPAEATDSRPARSIEIPAQALLNQVNRSIRLLAEGARSELHIKLHPAELGEVLVRLTIQDGLLTAQLQTSDAAVKATLDANLDALRARFEQHGLQVNALAVSTGAGQLTDDGQAKSGWTQQSSQPGRPASGDDGEGEEPEGSTPPVPVRRILGRRGQSRLDHLA